MWASYHGLPAEGHPMRAAVVIEPERELAGLFPRARLPRHQRAGVATEPIIMNPDPFDDPEKVDAFLKMMFTTCALRDWAKAMDGPELVFWMTKSGLGDAIKWGSLQEAVWEELETRLYPEYDGEHVLMTETGYMTPNGPVDYIGPDGKALRKAGRHSARPAFDEAPAQPPDDPRAPRCTKHGSKAFSCILPAGHAGECDLIPF